MPDCKTCKAENTSLASGGNRKLGGRTDLIATINSEKHKLTPLTCLQKVQNSKMYMPRAQISGEITQESSRRGTHDGPYACPVAPPSCPQATMVVKGGSLWRLTNINTGNEVLNAGRRNLSEN
ncbi:hypothetical protein ElyMa_004190000 [Elysia marginata]|uniref:Uncharacterized protein n=1 Tax=Elysia marginata TaxID=1093978 RepID=A0AAV4GLW2_9GAST|nr:hypothetical protein ElyMa_004190000 [Elysia marginata]